VGALRAQVSCPRRMAGGLRPRSLRSPLGRFAPRGASGPLASLAPRSLRSSGGPPAPLAPLANFYLLHRSLRSPPLASLAPARFARSHSLRSPASLRSGGVTGRCSLRSYAARLRLGGGSLSLTGSRPCGLRPRAQTCTRCRSRVLAPLARLRASLAPRLRLGQLRFAQRLLASLARSLRSPSSLRSSPPRRSAPRSFANAHSGGFASPPSASPRTGGLAPRCPSHLRCSLLTVAPWAPPLDPK